MTRAWSYVATAAASLGLTLYLGDPLIGWLTRLSLRQHAYEDAPESHAGKTGTPTMGGLLFVAALVVAVPPARRLGRAGWPLAALGLGCAAIGAVDDMLSIRGGRNRGLRGREKFVASGVAGAAYVAWIARIPSPARGELLRLSGLRWGPARPVWFVVATLAVVATTHSVNLTDGLDGLASGTVLPPLLVFAWLAARDGAPDVACIDLALAASVAGFLVFNRHPARVFMGDTGSLALGAVLAGSAIATGNALLLPLAGGVFAAEALSVIVQVAYFKRTRKRIFRMSPLHHHFELGGWAETKVTGRFWIASALLALAGARLAR